MTPVEIVVSTRRTAAPEADGFVFERPDWQAQANCIGISVGVMFPTRGDDTGPAKAVCGGCVVRAECLDFALTTRQMFGIWGGTSEQQRKRMRRGVVRPPAEHGRGRYWRGCRCEECRKANADYKRRKRA